MWTAEGLEATIGGHVHHAEDREGVPDHSDSSTSDLPSVVEKRTLVAL
jgi:hypothetical protein